MTMTTATTTATTATYAKLSNGSWGVRIVGKVSLGGAIEVAKKDGTKKVEYVTRLVWAKDDISLCEIAPSASPARITSKCRCGQMCPRCGSEPLNAKLHCWECGFTGK
jgi:hypothetical protein